MTADTREYFPKGDETEMSIVECEHITKRYPAFTLSDVSFSLDTGKITGFIGRNGAGKTTTIKAMLGLIRPDAGNVSYFGLPFYANEKAIKGRIGYSTGTVSWYPRTKIKDIVATVSSFYADWDDVAYRHYLDMFSIDENKTPRELSDGMRVKTNIMLALSHHAGVLILDEPTSALDAFSRDELLDVFRVLRDTGVAVFFSTHIISDIEKCADNILYISQGRIEADMPLDRFRSQFTLEGESLEDAFLRMEREKRASLTRSGAGKEEQS